MFKEHNMKRIFFMCMAILSCAVMGFEVRRTAEGAIQLVENNAVLVESIGVFMGTNMYPGEVQLSDEIVGGSHVINVWSEERYHKYRLEIAVPADGSQVELSFACSCEAYPTDSACGIEMRLLPVYFGTSEYAGLIDNSRSWKMQNGVVNNGDFSELAKSAWRFLSLSSPELGKLLFDFHPRGAGDENAMYRAGVVRGMWDVYAANGRLCMGCKTDLAERGGAFATKLVIRHGVFEDYDMLHAMRRFTYVSTVTPELRLSFGAANKGKCYTPADMMAYDPARNYGWESAAALGMVSYGDGVFYSNVNGQNAVFRCTGLRPGMYIATFNCGNFGGYDKLFDIDSSNVKIAERLRVPREHLVTVTVPLWIEGGEERFTFTGDFCISDLVLHRLFATAEDYTFRRGFWFTNGFEPECIYTNEDTVGDVMMQTAVDMVRLPPPGMEEQGTPKTFVFESAQTKSNADWRNNAIIGAMGSNDAALFEYAAPEIIGRFLDEQQSRGVNTIMLSGMHSRHTYPRQRQRVMNYVNGISSELHRRNMRLIDHHDGLLLWNDGAGFRTFVERLGETVLEPDGRMPGFNFCLMNPEFSRKCQDYLCELVANGVDALLVDEIYFANVGCRCSHCLNSFHEETGWWLPMNELDPRLNNERSDLWRLWCDWRKKKVGDWWVNCRNELARINPDVVLLTYSSELVNSYASNLQGVSITELGRAFDFFGSEIMTRNPYKSARVFPAMRKALKMLSLEYGAPIFSFIYASDWESLKYGWAVCRFSAQQPVALGGNTPNGKRNFWNFISPMPDSAQTAAKVALLFSAPSRDWATQVSFHRELYGLAQTLDEMHVAYEFIGEMSLRKAILDKYDVLFLANSSCLSDNNIIAIREFAERGGIVHMGPTCGWNNEHGSVRPWPFADVFNCVPTYSCQPVTKLSHVDGSELAVNAVPSKYWNVNGTVKGNAFDLFAQLEDGTIKPVMYEQQFGKGKFILQLMALHQTLFQPEYSNKSKFDFVYDNVLAAESRRFLEYIVGNSRGIFTNAPEKVQMNLFEKDGRFYLHLINATGVNNTVGELIGGTVPENPWPALEQDIAVTIYAPVSRRAYATSPDFDGYSELPFAHRDGGYVDIVLPAALLKTYTVIVIE